MSLSISVSENVFKRVPGLRLIILRASNIALIQEPHLPVSVFWQNSWKAVFTAGVRPADNPNVQAYRRALKAGGIKIQDNPPAVESLYRRATKSETPFSVSPLVDFYNGCTLKHGMPAAAFDVALLGASLELTEFEGTEEFHAIGRESSEVVEKNEIGYKSGTSPLSRHFMWRQSRKAALSESTKNLLLITEAVDGITDENIQEMTQSLTEGLTRWFGSAPSVHELNAGTPSVKL